MDSKLFLNEKTSMKYNLKLKLGINYEFCETEDISFENENNLHRFLLRFCSVCRIPLFSFFASVLLRFALIAYLNSGINILYLLFFIYRYVFYVSRDFTFRLDYSSSMSRRNKTRNKHMVNYNFLF